MMIVNSKTVEQVIIISTTIGVIIVLLVVVIGGWMFWKHKLNIHYDIAKIQQSKRKIWIWFMQDYHWNYAFHYCFIICVLEHGECLPIIVLKTSLYTQMIQLYVLQLHNVKYSKTILALWS